MKIIQRVQKEQKGSVMLEFILVLPSYLFLIGGTLLLLDIMLGKVYLQESNRNLAWIQNDRFDAGGLINKELIRRAPIRFAIRNAYEYQMDEETPMWSYTHINGIQLSKFTSKAGGVEIPCRNPWYSFYTANMQLEMNRISGVYLGALAISSVMYPVETNANNNQKAKTLYQRSYSLTRKEGEILVVRRMGGDEREKANSLLGYWKLYYYPPVKTGWPAPTGDNLVGTIVNIIETILGF